MPKLKLKRTPAEAREHELRKARKRAKRTAAARADGGSYDFVFDLPNPPTTRATQFDDWDVPDPHGLPDPSSTTSDADYQRILRELEERRFRAKLADALDADADDSWAARADETEARMNDFAHVPRRWRAGGMRFAEAPDAEAGNPEDMEDDEYAEWIRKGVWRRTHAAEFEAAERERAAHAERLRQAKEGRSETQRLERVAQEDEERRRLERALERVEEARRTYEQRWRALLQPDASDGQDMAFTDVPWPVLPARAGASIQLADIVPTALERFLVPPAPPQADDVDWLKLRKDRLRETMLRFHPDKFSSRVLRKVRDADREDVEDGVGRVVRGITELLQTQM